MEKPIMVARQEFIDKFNDLLNSSNLHPAIIQPIVEEANKQLMIRMQQLYIKEKEEYDKSLRQEETK